MFNFTGSNKKISFDTSLGIKEEKKSFYRKYEGFILFLIWAIFMSSCFSFFLISIIDYAKA